MPAIPMRDDIYNAMKAAMRAKDKPRLGVIRLILAAIKQREVDERIELNDEQVLVILDKMVKQRRDSIRQFEAADRQDLADQEKYEISILQEYLPAALSNEELQTIIKESIAAEKATSPKDMGKIMGILKPKVQGRCDMSEASKIVKQLLNS
ncbi:Transamidase GatB domain protein [hydrothermal vent metagenome]|uniref:Transamidase GatB domain protein n=1 Tax=hydrothermal vent metagenome TaxID=652676 RepID=A0A3B1A1B4_9ZZZZ